MSSRVLFLSDNSWAIKRGSDSAKITDDLGVVPANGTLTARCYLAATDAYNAAAIHSSLDVSGVEITDGKLRTVLSGSNLRTHLTPLLDTAEAASQQLEIYEHIVVTGNYHDVKELLVKRVREVV